MSRNVQGVVAVVFIVLALSFIATTAVLYMEFRDDGWFTLAAFYSHLFIFFPTFGLLALAAFFVPACALLDLYWHHVKHGPARFAIGSFVLIAVSLGASAMLVTGVPAVWWLKPGTLAADLGNPAGCSAPQCKRQPVMASVKEVRAISRVRLGLSPFVRECLDDQLMEIPLELMQPRHCFVTMTKLTAAQCCMAQKDFTADLSKLYDSERGNHSVTGVVHAKLLPLKIFFLLMIFAIGVLLALWRRTIDQHYRDYTGRIERGLLIGALAMLLWPVANHGFLQSSSLLYGRAGEGIYATISPVLSFLFAAWALMLVVFFFRRHERDIEAAGKIGGGMASAVAIIKYNEIIDYATRFLGSGADLMGLSVLGLVLVGAFIGLVAGVPKPAPVVPVPYPDDQT